jgi:hypothetical protein
LTLLRVALDQDFNKARNMAHLLKLAGQLREAGSFDDMFGPLKELCDFLGLDGFTWFFMHGQGEVHELDTRPQEWKEKYTQEGLLLHDPIVQTAASVTTPFRWDKALKTRRLSPKEKIVINGGRDFDITEGFNTPIHDVGLTKGSLCFYHDNIAHVQEVLEEYGDLLQYVSYLCQVNSKLLLKPAEQSPSTGPLLSPGEREVLTLAAQGVKVRDMPEKTGIGYNGVRTRLYGAMKTLSASTSGQATVLALMRGEISPFDMGINR